MKSLVIVAAPRSASTLCYRLVKDAVGANLFTDWSGKAAAFGGEGLSHVAFLSDRQEDTLQEMRTKAFVFFDKYRNDSLFKMANDHFLLEEYIQENPGSFNVLYLKRHPADCVHRLLERKWLWPLSYPYSFSETEDFFKELSHCEDWGLRSVEAAPYMADGVLRMQRICDNIATETILYSELVFQPGVLFKLLESFKYPTVWFDYLTPGFVGKRAECLEIRKTFLWQAVERIVQIRSMYHEGVNGHYALEEESA